MVEARAIAADPAWSEHEGEEWADALAAAVAPQLATRPLAPYTCARHPAPARETL